jgi:hypothetical protein
MNNERPTMYINQGFGLVSNFVLNRKFRASKSPTFHILTVGRKVDSCHFVSLHHYRF